MIAVTPHRWAEFLHWAEHIYADRAALDADETNYKLEVGNKVAAARAAFMLDDDWFGLLEEAFRGRNNLTDWRAHGHFLGWCKQAPADAREALSRIWDDAKSPALAVTGFAARFPNSALSGGGQRLSIASFLLMGRDAMSFAVYRSEPVFKAYRLVGHRSTMHEDSLGGRYEEWLEFLDRLWADLRERGFDLRHRLDAQSLAWCIVQGEPNKWESAQHEALAAFRDSD
jgi:hypothetical protein